METETTVMENLGTSIQSAFSTITTVMSSALETAISNPLIMLFVAAGFVGLAIGVFKKLKKVGK